MIHSKHNYPVFIGNNTKEQLEELFRNLPSGTKSFILVDENTEAHCLPLLDIGDSNYELIKTCSGEINKNLDTVATIWKQLTMAKADRKTLLINLGGGVISDLGGFVASTYKRGIHHINIPTTLLAQADACVGSKTGINTAGIRNLAGTYKAPESVYIYPEFLSTLPTCQLYSGFAEILKHALISSIEMWHLIKNFQPEQCIFRTDLLQSSIDVKMKIVKEDLFDTSVRKQLNFGHTIGHALESISIVDGSPLLHGFAVSAGILCAGYLSEQYCGLSPDERKSIESVLLGLYRDKLPEIQNINKLIDILYNDKKNNLGAIHFTLLDRIGKAVVDFPCDERAIIDALHYYENLIN